jgi:nucleoid DNA-binding protein
MSEAEVAMKRKTLAKDLARTANLPPAVAQDKVDEVVHELLRRLRAGEPPDLKSLGLDEKWMIAKPASGKW